MNDFRGIVAHQVESLGGALRVQRDQRCRALLNEARARAAALEKRSRRAARERVHAAVIEERKRRETALVQVRHRLETAARRRIQARYDELLARARPRLVQELEARWQSPDARREWCEMLLDEAAQLLGNEGWRVAHPDPAAGNWSAAAGAALSQALAARGIAAPECHAATDVEAGLRIDRGGACLDGTIAGLLRRQRTIDGRLLAHWELESGRAAEDRRA